MHFSTIAPMLIAALAEAASVVPVSEPNAGPFYMDWVYNNGSVLPAVTGEVSRGAVILSPAKQFTHPFSYHAENKTLVITGQDSSPCDRETDDDDSLVGFLGNFDPSFPALDLIQVTEGSNSTETFLVSERDADKGAAGWYALWPQGDFVTNVFWVGADDPRANAKLRVEKEKPRRMGRAVRSLEALRRRHAALDW